MDNIVPYAYDEHKGHELTNKQTAAAFPQCSQLYSAACPTLLPGGFKPMCPQNLIKIIIISCSGQLSGQQQTANMIEVSKTSSVRDPDFSASI